MTLIQLKSFCRFKTWCTSTHCSCLYIYTCTHTLWKAHLNRKVLTLVLNFDNLKKERSLWERSRGAIKATFFQFGSSLTVHRKIGQSIFFLLRETQKDKSFKRVFWTFATWLLFLHEFQSNSNSEAESAVLKMDCTFMSNILFSFCLKYKCRLKQFSRKSHSHIQKISPAMSVYIWLVTQFSMRLWWLWHWKSFLRNKNFCRFCCPQYLLDKLQKVQNAAARLHVYRKS